MTVTKPTKKVKKWKAAQFMEISAPTPKELKYSSHSLAYEIIYSIKTDSPMCWGLSHCPRWPTLCLLSTFPPWINLSLYYSLLLNSF